MIDVLAHIDLFYLKKKTKRKGILIKILQCYGIIFYLSGSSDSKFSVLGLMRQFQEYLA